MAGDVVGPRVDLGDVSFVARVGEYTWRIDEAGNTWRLTWDDLMAIDESWSGDPDDRSPAVAEAIAMALSARRPWAGSVDPDLPLRWAEGIDTTRPSAARVYDALLDGGPNFAADRETARRSVAADPRAPEYARANRAFLWRAVRFLLAMGVRQFLDLGSGLPTVSHVHELAQRADPSARVVYVDVDPILVAHSHQLLEGNDLATVIHADLRDADAILGRVADQQLLDLSQPVGSLMVAVLHFVPDDDDPAGIMARYRRGLHRPSHVVISHACPSLDETPQIRTAADAYRATMTPLTLRQPWQVAALFDGWGLVAPGLVDVNRWRPEHDDVATEPVPGVAGVGFPASKQVATVRRGHDPGS